ncbi:hypothetical protein ACIXSZ_19250 [Bacteroides fragilis]|uniref:hypothetical protein n=1 Tax=Bacteroides fragilis TaxID=817 RepID=UPI0004535EDC|nr:hypothetical protein [Bacteroides fragilis]EYA65359.1 hypothetical protein M139_3311 [Bacteroides fragilis str. S23L24]EYE43192.1 hypothetical protein M138_3249 [Bacteroides fragilis str. S23L17]MCS2589406.1 hypothetical protein [Bacteroides fragilis]
MTNLLYLFNPDQDLALASGEVNYMPPASARRMAEELALLPVWFADGPCSVLAPSAYNQSFLEEMLDLFPLPASLRTQAEDFSEVRSVVPWGWNPALRKRLLSLGVPDAALPSMEDIGRLRDLSHRLQAVQLLPGLQVDEVFCGESCYLTALSDCRAFVESLERCLLKAPLSGSGKGLNWCKGAFTPLIERWCARVIEQQGGVVGEPIYNKVEDFAMEFYSDGKGRIIFAGYSLFRTNAGGAYEGNRLLPDAEIERRLLAYVPVAALHRLREELQRRLSVSLGTEYAGYLGVDMMICRFALLPEFRIHPCVEINLRMNMGLVSRMLYDRYVRPGAGGTFRISYHPSDGQALQEHDAMTVAHPLHTRNGRVVKGYLPLVPVRKSSRYRAYILVETGG